MRKRRKDRALRKRVAERPCLICGRSPCDPHHFPVRQSHGGQDTQDNMVPLCRIHHSAYHDGDHQVMELVEQAAPRYFDALTTD
jgi:predicted restriction endonuclease